MAIKTDGSLWAWGASWFGVLGIGIEANESWHNPVRVGTSYDWYMISAGGTRSVGIKTDGSLWQWGVSIEGRYGHSTRIVRNTPARIGDQSDWAFVSVGAAFAMAIKTDGSLWGWGSNSMGQLGLGTNRIFEFHDTPVRIGQDFDWAFVSAGYTHSLAVKTDGSLWAWGWISYGFNIETGGRNITVAIPTQIGEETNWVTASAALNSTAIRKDGSLWVWGRDFNTQMNYGTGSNLAEPVQIGTDTDWLLTSAHASHTMAIKTDGSLWAWGSLGWYDYYEDGDLKSRPLLNYGNIPARIWEDIQWSYISATNIHVIGISANGLFWAWGNNHRGQLGDGTAICRIVSVKITF